VPIDNFSCLTLPAVTSKGSQSITSTLTVYTPSDVLVKAGISLATDISATYRRALCGILSVEIPGDLDGPFTLNVGATTVEYILDSVTFYAAAAGLTGMTAFATAFVVTQGE